MNRPRFPLKPGYDIQPISDLSQHLVAPCLVKVNRREDEVQELSSKYSTPNLNAKIKKKAKKQRHKVVLKFDDCFESPPPERSSTTIDNLQELFMEKVRFMERLKMFNDFDTNSTLLKEDETFNGESVGDEAFTSPIHESINKDQGLINQIEFDGQHQKETKCVPACLRVKKEVKVDLITTESTTPVKVVNTAEEFCEILSLSSSNYVEDVDKGSLKGTEQLTSHSLPFKCTANYYVSKPIYIQSQSFYNRKRYKGRERK